MAAENPLPKFTIRYPPNLKLPYTPRKLFEAMLRIYYWEPVFSALRMKYHRQGWLPDDEMLSYRQVTELLARALVFFMEEIMGAAQNWITTHIGNEQDAMLGEAGEDQAIVWLAQAGVLVGEPPGWYEGSVSPGARMEIGSRLAVLVWIEDYAEKQAESMNRAMVREMHAYGIHKLADYMGRNFPDVLIELFLERRGFDQLREEFELFWGPEWEDRYAAFGEWLKGLLAKQVYRGLEIRETSFGLEFDVKRILSELLGEAWAGGELDELIWEEAEARLEAFDDTYKEVVQAHHDALDWTGPDSPLDDWVADALVKFHYLKTVEHHSGALLEYAGLRLQHFWYLSELGEEALVPAERMGLVAGGVFA